MSRVGLEIEQEYGPFSEQERVHGVTFDGQAVWFATDTKLQAFDPKSGALTRALAIACDAGTAFDGEHLYQLAKGRILKIDPHTGSVISSIPAPDADGTSGMAWAEGSLWVGRLYDRKILQLDPATGKVLSEVASDRFVTGVSFCAGELWHATAGELFPATRGERAELRRVDPKTGEVLERLELPAGLGVTGLETDGQGRFYCGGGNSGKVRVVRRPKQSALK
jgi:streptogramin lyase